MQKIVHQTVILSDGNEVHVNIEVPEVPGQTPDLQSIEVQPAVPSRSNDWLGESGGGPHRFVKAAHELLGSASELIRVCAEKTIENLRSKSTLTPDEIEVKFGIKLDSELGAILCGFGKLGGEAGLEVALKWLKDRKAPTDSPPVSEKQCHTPVA